MPKRKPVFVEAVFEGGQPSSVFISRGDRKHRYHNPTHASIRRAVNWILSHPPSERNVITLPAVDDEPPMGVISWRRPNSGTGGA